MNTIKKDQTINKELLEEMLSFHTVGYEFPDEIMEGALAMFIKLVESEKILNDG